MFSGEKMTVIRLFQDSLSYPINDIDKLLTLGVLFFFDAIFSLLPSITIALSQDFLTPILYFISNLIGFIIFIIAIGYITFIIKDTVDNKLDFPHLNLIKNFSKGIKVFFISIIYYIVPIVITILFSYIIGAYAIISEIITSFFSFGYETSIPTYSMVLSVHNIILVPIVAVILFIISTIFLIIAISRFSYYGDMKFALDLKAVIYDIGNITWKYYLISLIILCVILILILSIVIVIAVIPFFGFIILFLIILPFITIFWGRSVGLIYRKSKINK